MAYVIKLSKSGKNVNTCADKDLIFSSELDMLKTKISSTTSGTGDIEIAHNLAYVPVCFAIKKIATDKYGIISQQSYKVSDTNLVINADDSTTEYFRYYIFYEELNT